MAKNDGRSSSLANEFKKCRQEELQLQLVESVVSQFQLEVDKDMAIKDELRIVARNLEKATKAVVHVLQRVHIDAENDEKVMAIGEKAEKMLANEVAAITRGSVDKMPPGDYFRYSEFIRPHVIRSVFAIGLSGFLCNRPFLTLEKTSEILGIPTVEKKGKSTVFLEWEEYLEGMLDVGQELARLAKNCVIMDNYKLVSKIHKYITALNYGFSGMNFKNDTLRRKYDSLKYDSRAIEEVVYDLMMKKVEKVEEKSQESGSVEANETV